jgi:sec-independent protein translocase protein TatA
MNVVFAVFGLGGTELMVVMGAVLLLFGPKKLPELARGLGKGIREFKKASNEVTEELERAVEEPAVPLKKTPPEGSLPHSSISRDEPIVSGDAEAAHEYGHSHSEQQQPK